MHIFMTVPYFPSPISFPAHGGKRQFMAAEGQLMAQNDS